MYCGSVPLAIGAHVGEAEPQSIAIRLQAVDPRLSLPSVDVIVHTRHIRARVARKERPHAPGTCSGRNRRFGKHGELEAGRVFTIER